MQTNHTIIDKEIDSFSSKGSTDAKLNKEVSIDSGKIKPAARNAYYQIKAKYTGWVEQIKIKYEQTAEKIDELHAEINNCKDKIKDVKVASRVKLFFLYLMPGLVFIGGDVMFSKELIVNGWGLGAENEIEKWILCLAIGLAPLFIKYPIEQHFLPMADKGSVRLKKWLTGASYFMALIMIVLSSQTAYVRSIFFRFMSTDSGSENIYNQLFNHFGESIQIGFVGVNLMLILAGSFMLGVFTYESAKRKELKAQIKDLDKNQNELKSNQEVLSELRRKQVETETLLNEWENKDDCIEHLENELKYAYKNGFTAELTSPKRNNHDLEFESLGEDKDNFHIFTKNLIKQYSINKKGNSYHA